MCGRRGVCARAREEYPFEGAPNELYQVRRARFVISLCSALLAGLEGGCLVADEPELEFGEAADLNVVDDRALQLRDKQADEVDRVEYGKLPIGQPLQLSGLLSNGDVAAVVVDVAGVVVVAITAFVSLPAWVKVELLVRGAKLIAGLVRVLVLAVGRIVLLARQSHVQFHAVGVVALSAHAWVVFPPLLQDQIWGYFVLRLALLVKIILFDGVVVFLGQKLDFLHFPSVFVSGKRRKVGLEQLAFLAGLTRVVIIIIIIFVVATQRI